MQCMNSYREVNGTPLQYSCLENPMDGGAWWAAVHGVAKSRTGLSDFPFTSHFHALEKEMATHSSVLAWRIPGTGEPGGSMGSHRVRHDWSNLAAAAVLRAWPRDLPKGMHFVQGSTWEAESLNHFAVHLKQTNYYKSTIPQFKEKIFPHQKLFQIL